MSDLPVIGIPLGDSAGIGPELAAKTAASGFLNSVCRPLIIGDSRVFANALTLIGKTAEHYPVASADEADWTRGIPVLDRKNQDPRNITPGQLDAGCGQAVMDMLTVCCELCQQGAIAGVCFAPLNKAAMKKAGSMYESEHAFFTDKLGVTGPAGEINVLNEVSTTRITSHIPFKDVVSHLTEKLIVDAISLAYKTVSSFGIQHPRVAVAALNPHGGENGNCGTEEITLIGPAIEKANAQGMNALGPFPADTLFIRVFNGEFDSVVTMYHDQGQIAMKLKGFEWGVTVVGGMPYPIATPAHGTAFDIAGKGLAKTSAFESALKLVVRMATNN
ncbi:MAG: 4-hydroxythreonine-4-phosphate dehydrogenase PdxA [Treponema sp.]|nr:4-hydroxythreonine-4-phosphate dehydrogenase PdxA [Treponema sp.]